MTTCTYVCTNICTCIFFVVRCTGSLTSFADNLLKVLPGVVQEGIDWLDEAHSSSANAPMTNNLIEAVTRAIACEGVSYSVSSTNKYKCSLFYYE